MTPRMDMAKVLVRYSGGPDGLEGDVLRMLEGSFGPVLSRLRGGDEASGAGGNASDAERVAHGVAQVVASFSRSATMPAVREKAIEGIYTRVLEFVRRSIPVEAQMLWSPKKHWIVGDESAVDLAELAALQTLLSIDSTVRDVYPRGVSFLLEVEDIEFEFMEGQDKEVVVARETYISSLRRLIGALQLGDVFTLRRVSEHAQSKEELLRWRQQMAANYRALETYWYESEERTLSSQEDLPSFKELRRLGWTGTIPADMRRYYLNRLGKLADAPERERVDMVLRNLAGILFHHQMGLLRGSGVADPVRFSFVRSADAAPPELLVGRVDLRFAPRRLCSRVSAAAPWATKGFVCGRKDRLAVSFRGWHELDGAQYRFAEGWLTVAGCEGIAKVRADFRRNEVE